MSADVSSPVPVFGKRPSSEFEFSLKCKRRVGSGSAFENGKRSHHTLSPESSFESMRVKRSRTLGYGGADDEGKDTPIYSLRHMEFLEQRKQTELAKLKSDFQQCVDRKDHELQLVTQQNTKLAESFSTFQQEIEKLNNENRILKRAVTIQNQQKEESHQEVQAMKVLLQQAAEHIKRLEQKNYALCVHLQTTSGNNGTASHFEYPPNVF